MSDRITDFIRRVESTEEQSDGDYGWLAQEYGLTEDELAEVASRYTQASLIHEARAAALARANAAKSPSADDLEVLEATRERLAELGFRVLDDLPEA